MTNNDKADNFSDVELDIEEEKQEESPFTEFDISVSPSDPTLELLVNQLKTEDLIIPFYQRRYVWSITQASKLIESFLMGLPVPQIFLYVNDENIMEVIDGQQRLLSIKYFMDGYFGEESDKGFRKVFKLEKLSPESPFSNKTFNELPAKQQRKLKNSTLRTINIRQLKPDNKNDCVFHIFERLNTGGTQLKPQEIRNAVYRGNIVNELQLLNANKNWKTILGLKKQDKNQKDIEIILRLFSLYQKHSSYEKPMLKFLNQSMANNTTFDSNLALEFQHKFPNVTKQLADSVKEPFRPKGLLILPFLEAVLIALLELKNTISNELLNERYNLLQNNEDFKTTITGGTTDTNLLKRRIKIAKSIIETGNYSE